MVVPRRHPRILVRYDTDLLHGRRECSIDVDLPCGFGLQIAETRRRTLCATMLKGQERHRKDRSNYH